MDGEIEGVADIVTTKVVAGDIEGDALIKIEPEKEYDGLWDEET